MRKLANKFIKMKNNPTFKSAISNLSFPENEKIWGKSIHDPILGLIIEDFPSFSDQDCIAVKELNEYRQKYISRYLSTEIGTLSDLEKSVINSLKEDKSIVNIVEDEEEARSLAEAGLLFFRFCFLLWFGLVPMFIFWSIKVLIRIRLFY